MLSTLQRRFPLFMKDICTTFGNHLPRNTDPVAIIPSYITPHLIKYCNSTNNPRCDDFLGTIPSYFLANHCDNRSNVHYIVNNENKNNN